MDVDRRNFREGQYRVGLPVARQHALAVVAHLFFQRPADRLHDAAFGLIDHAVRIDDLADIDCSDRARHMRIRFQRKIDHHRHIAVAILVLREGKAAAAGAVALRAGFPAGFLGGDFDHGARARVFQVAQAEFNRVAVRRRGEFVHERFDREHIADGAEPAQGRRAKRLHFDTMRHHALVRQRVNHRRIARHAAAARHRRIGLRASRHRLFEIPSRQQRRHRRRRLDRYRPLAVAVAPDLDRPVDDIAGVVEGGMHVGGHRRAVGFPRELVVAHPLHLHRAAAGRARQQHRVERDVVGAVVAVTARAFAVMDDDFFKVHLQHGGEVVAQLIHALAVRPHFDTLAVNARQRAGGADRSVGDIGFGVARIESARAACFRRHIDAF